jgi:ABC-type bacteriocin/lantibiotic exporter with double-glycine peptidase domain
MKNLLSSVGHKINGIILTLISTGIFMLILGILVVWTDLVLRLLVGLLIIVIAYVFFYGAYKVWHMKKEIEKFIKLK